ncbi:unnamed protein product [Aphis gossypii]|uniref:Uncharacterized protein n=1 Tax=Aphis gossypii TaxID=80765 RepID=A0A9P0NKX0_APHGO|nr:unnamed protein product [Aphis gossypii]
MCNIDKLADDYIMSNVKGYTPDIKSKALTSIQVYNISLTKQKNMVDKHIRKLDLDLSRFEAEIQDKSISATRNIEGNSQKQRCKKKNKDKDIKKKNLLSEEELASNNTAKKKQLKKRVAKITSAAHSKARFINVVTKSTNPTNIVTSITVESSSLTGALVDAGSSHSTEVLDMPVDPNEPTYCLCNQVSYGE